MGLIALEENIINEKKLINCSGAYSLKNHKRPFKCWKKEGHGPSDLSYSLTQSCDVFFYRVAELTGIDTISENLYKSILNKDIEDASWPEANFFHRNETEIKYLVQVNGKVRATILIDSEKSEDDVKEIAKEHENVSRHLENKDIIKVIFIKNRLINFVHS